MATRQLDKMRAIELPGGYVLGERGLEVNGNPTLAQHEAAGLFIDRVNRAGGWWKVDWIAYADTRPEWKEQMEESIPSGTRRQYRYIGKAYPPLKRIDGVDFGHHAALVNFEPELRTRVLKAAAVEGWTQRETVHAAKSAAKSTQTLASGGVAAVHEVELTILVSMEAAGAGAAERASWDVLKALLKAVVNPAWLKAQVIASHARPTLEEP